MKKSEYVLKVEHGYVKVYHPDGTFKGYVCGNAVSAEIRADGMIHVTTQREKVRRYKIDEIAERLR